MTAIQLTDCPTAARPATVLRSASAELYRLRTWPALWAIVAAWFVLVLLFGYVFPYVSYRTGTDSVSTEGQSAASLLADVLPAAFPMVVVQGAPLFGGALVLVLAALIAGNGYGWGTWKTALAQSRTRPILGALLALATIVLALVLVTAVVCAGVSLLLAGVESQPVVWPSLTTLAQALGSALLVLGMWGAVGYALGTWSRSAALSVGVGLVWLLVVENLLRGVGSMLGWVADLVTVLPGTAAGSLIGAVLKGVDGTPGVLDTISAPRAIITLVIVSAGAVAATLALVRRRDVG